MGTCSEIEFRELSTCRKPRVYQFWKRRAPGNDEGPLNKILKSWIWDQPLPENMKWKLGFSETEKL